MSVVKLGAEGRETEKRVGGFPRRNDNVVDPEALASWEFRMVQAGKK